MSLNVSGTAAFQGEVLDALRQICTCRPIKTSAGTVVLGVATDPCCCGTPLGCSLLANLLEDCETDVTIVNYCKSTYDPKAREINFCTDAGETALDCDGKRSPIGASLAHEMIHAWLHCLDDPTKPYTDESVVICAENQIRQEMGVTPRCPTGATIAPSCGWLPNDWEVPSSCHGAVAYWVCRFQESFGQVLYALRTRLKWPKLAPPRRDAHMPTSPRGSEDLWDWSEPPTLEKRIAQAEWVRAREPLAHRIDELIAEIEVAVSGQRPILLLEEITIDHPYDVTLIYEKDGWIEVVSNRAADSRLTRYSFGPRTLDRHPGLGDLWGRVTFPAGPPPSFGDPAITDGTVQFLELRTGGRVDRRTAMYGYYFPEANPGVAPPDDPVARSRWEAIAAFHELRDAVMRLEPDSVQWVGD